MALFDSNHRAAIRRGQEDRRLCWAVGAYLLTTQPDIFKQLASDVLSKPNPVLARMLYAASGLHARSLKRVQAMRDAVQPEQVAEAEAALRKARDAGV